MKASVAIQTLPDVDNDEELIRIVDEVIAYIKSTGLSYYVGPFETAIEGDSYDQLMDERNASMSQSAPAHRLSPHTSRWYTTRNRRF